ncbi:MAG: isoaspartyl peptidase/L-asparaginase [Thermoplasmata archaeon]|nr:isoaspartyl peptidase/L-asparaginase [Thermoplasmata archaeon]
MYGMIVHGGAWDIPDDIVDAHLTGVKKAIEIGLDILKNGGLAEEAVEAAIGYMEDDPVFDAGKGSFLNRNGEVELDAIMYHGTLMGFGACMCVKTVKNPIKLARMLMKENEVSILAGSGADAYAKNQGLEIVDNSYFVVEREKKRFGELKTKNLHPSAFFHHGTVGAVALDSQGNIVAGTSTGGTPNKLPGRVGDSPIPGAGAFANPVAGASATGYGEAILRCLLTFRACDAVEKGCSPSLACKEAVRFLEEKTGMFAGLIVLRNNGESGFAYNTPRMARAYLKNGKIVAEV